MTHSMNLNESPFQMIMMGKKTIELRLNDEKRRLIHIGDYILFTNTSNKTETLLVEVINLYHFDSFKTLYESLPLNKCGYEPDELSSASPDDMLLYYTEKEQQLYGVLGIELKCLKSIY